MFYERTNIIHMCHILISTILSFTSKVLVRSISLVPKDVSPCLQANYEFGLDHPRRAHIFHLKIVKEWLMCTHVVSVILHTSKNVIRLRAIRAQPPSVRMNLKVESQLTHYYEFIYYFHTLENNNRCQNTE